MGSIAGSGSILPLILLILAVIICLFLIRKYWIKRERNDDVRICPNCRQPVESDSAYCENCGTKIPAASEDTGKRTGIGKIFKKKRKIITSTVCAICTIIIAFFIFIYSHDMRWDYFIGGSENIYGIGAYGSDRSGEERYGLYRRHWYGYEDLTDGYTLEGVQVTNQYIAKKENGLWNFTVPDDSDFYMVFFGFSDIMPLVVGVNGSLQETLAQKTGMVWVKSINGGKWGTVNIHGQNYSIDFIYDNVLPDYEFDNNGANIICKRDSLWGMLHIPYVTGSKITEYVPFIFSKPEFIQNEVKIVNDYYVVTEDYVTTQYPNMIYGNGRIDKSESGYSWSKGQQFFVNCIYSGYAFFNSGSTGWHCLSISYLSKD